MHSYNLVQNAVNTEKNQNKTKNCLLEESVRVMKQEQIISLLQSHKEIYYVCV